MQVHVGVPLVGGGTLACAPLAHALCASKHDVEGERLPFAVCMCVCQRQREIGHPTFEDAATNQPMDSLRPWENCPIYYHVMILRAKK